MAEKHISKIPKRKLLVCKIGREKTNHHFTLSRDLYHVCLLKFWVAVYQTIWAEFKQKKINKHRERVASTRTFIENTNEL